MAAGTMHRDVGKVWGMNYVVVGALHKDVGYNAGIYLAAEVLHKGFVVAMGNQLTHQVFRGVNMLSFGIVFG